MSYKCLIKQNKQKIDKMLTYFDIILNRRASGNYKIIIYLFIYGNRYTERVPIVKDFPFNNLSPNRRAFEAEDDIVAKLRENYIIRVRYISECNIRMNYRYILHHRFHIGYAG